MQLKVDQDEPEPTEDVTEVHNGDHEPSAPQREEQGNSHHTGRAK